MLDYRKVSEFFLNNDLINQDKDSETFKEYMTVAEEFIKDKIVRFDREFRNHEESRRWALSILEGKKFVGVDGSQIYHDPHIKLPLALVQASYFSNWHSVDKKFEKDSIVDVISLERHNQETNKFSSIIDDEYIDFKRAELEIGLIKKLINDDSEDSLYFVDNGLSPEFSMADIYSAKYKLMFTDLIDLSFEKRKKIVGYIAKPHSKHLVKKIREMNYGLKNLGFLTDALLLEGMLKWGDYTAPEKLNEKVYFSYIRVGEEVSRIELPYWIVENGLAGEVVLNLLAESIIGLGYPYILEAAHNTVVIQGKERMMFYDIALKKLGGDIFSKKAMKKLVAKKR